jgi:cardiolipin synthase
MRYSYSRANLFTYLRLLPNQITAIRFLLVPIMWVMAMTGFYQYIGIGLILCFVSDALDGYTARRLNQVTEFGGKFDSLADNILIPSAVVWLLMFRPEVFTNHAVIFIVAIVTYMASIIVGLIKFRRFGNLHLYLSKISGVVQYVFIIHTFISANYSKWLFCLMIGIFFLSSLETLLLQLTRIEVNAGMRSILCIRKASRSQNL